jgi:hypothetical protein
VWRLIDINGHGNILQPAFMEPIAQLLLVKPFEPQPVFCEQSSRDRSFHESSHKLTGTGSLVLSPLVHECLGYRNLHEGGISD